MSARRILLVIGLALLALVLLLAGSGATVFFTQPGTSFALRTALRFAPPGVTIGEVRGSFNSPLELRDVRYVNDTLEARIALIRLKWRPRALFSKALHVDTLLVDQVAIRLKPEAFSDSAAADTAASEPLPTEPPIAIIIDELKLSGLSVEWGDLVRVNGAALHLTGRHDDYRLDGVAVITAGTAKNAPNIPETRVTLDGRGNMSRFDLARLMVETLNGTIRAEGEATWRPGVSWRVTASGEGLEPDRAMPDSAAWPGVLGFRFHTEGSYDSTGPRGAVVLDTLSGTLRGYPLGVSASFEMAGPELIMSTARGAWGPVELSGKGRILETIDVNLLVNVPDLGIPLPGAKGRLEASVLATGARMTPLVKAEWSGSELAYDSTRIGAVSGNLALDLARDTGSVRMSADRIAMGARAIDSVRLAGSVTPDSLALATLAAGPELGLDAAISGAGLHTLRKMQEGTQWPGIITRLDATVPVAGKWNLRSPARLVAGMESATLDTLCMESEGAVACAGGSWKKAGPIALRATIANLAFARFQESYPQGMELKGVLAADADLVIRPDSTFTGSSKASVDGMTVRYAAEGRPVALIQLTPATFSMVAADSGTTSAIKAGIVDSAGTELAAFDVTLGLPGFHHLRRPDSTQAVTARVLGGSPDLRWVNAWVPEVTGLAGSLAVDLTATGTMVAPLVEGQARVSGFAATIPQLGLDLADGELDFTQDREHGIGIKGGITSGGGRLTVEGSSPIVPSAARPGKVHIGGEKFLAVNTTEVRILVSPAVDVAFTKDSVDVSGTVTIPTARVELMEVPELPVAVSPDVVFTDTLGREQPNPYKVTATIKVALGEDVFFSGFGFTSFFEGELAVRQVPNEIAVGNGELRFREGRFYSYGQNLTIHDGQGGQAPGRIVLAGPVDNPSIALKAYRMADDGTEAGLDVKGSMKEPTVTVYSVPAMAQANALSYLMFGRGIDQGSQSEKMQVGNAAMYLGGNMVATRMATKVGLDEARIEPGSSGSMSDASLLVGKYLSPRLYAAYGLSLFDRTSKFRLRYLISRALSVQTESGSAMGADVFWRFDQGKGGARKLPEKSK